MYLHIVYGCLYIYSYMHTTYVTVNKWWMDTCWTLSSMRGMQLSVGIRVNFGICNILITKWLDGNKMSTVVDIIEVWVLVTLVSTILHLLNCSKLKSYLILSAGVYASCVAHWKLMNTSATLDKYWLNSCFLRNAARPARWNAPLPAHRHRYCCLGAELGFFNVPGSSRLQPQDQACELEYPHGQIPTGTCSTKGCSHGRVSFSPGTRHNLLGLSWLGGHFVAVESFSHVCLCNPMDCCTSGFHVLHHLLELAQTHVELVMPSNHLILCPPLLFLPSVFSIRVFSNDSAFCIR